MTLGLYTKPTSHFTSKVRDTPRNYNSQRKENKPNKNSKLLKRIPLKRLMDLKVDYAFKQLFGNEKNKRITVVFLNAILQKTGRGPIRNISFKNVETGGEYADDKQSRLDLLVFTVSGEWINVEIQFSNTHEMIERSIFYWSKTYTDPLERGMAYKELHPVIAINIFNFNLFKETKRFHTSYHLLEDDEKFKLTNLMEFHFIEMPKLLKDWKSGKLDPRNDVLARWLLLLGMVDHRNGKFYDDIYMELEEIAMEDESLREAFSDWEELSMTQEQRLAYQSRLKHILDEEARQRRWELREQEEKERKERLAELEERVEKSKKEIEESKKRIEQDKKELDQDKKELDQDKKEIVEREKKANLNAKKEIAQRLLASGMAIENVVTTTDLPKKEIDEIKQNMQE